MIRLEETRTGKIVTFYSYKGGVGRSFALANVAALLARWRFRVLCIDWDIEAPGLGHYFGMRRAADGLVDMLTRWRRGDELRWRDHVREVEIGSNVGLSLMSAGRRGRNYSRRAQALDWKRMYDAGLGGAFEAMAAEMREEFDFVLIDSRTGITDFAAIVTAQLPDVLVFMFTANEQSLEGCTEVAERAAAVRRSMPIERGALRLMPIPARFEGRVEYSISQKWKARFYDRLRPFYRSWLVQEVDHRRIVDLTTIPHVPFWTFGEHLAVVQEADGGYAPDSISHALETIAAMLAKDLSGTEILEEDRDAYVGAVSRRGARQNEGSLDVYLSHAQSDEPMAKLFIAFMHDAGLTLQSSMSTVTDHDLSTRNSEQINRAQHMLVMVGTEWGQWQEAEVRAFRRQSAVDERPRYLLPILLHPECRVPASLLSYKTIDLSQGMATAVRHIELMLNGASASP